MYFSLAKIEIQRNQARERLAEELKEIDGIVREIMKKSLR